MVQLLRRHVDHVKNHILNNDVRSKDDFYIISNDISSQIDSTPNADQYSTVEPQRTSRQRRPPQHYGDDITS